MLRKTVFILSAFLFFCINEAGAVTSIGGLRKVRGDAVVIRNGASIPAVNGLSVMENDVIQTEKGASLGIVFRDNTRLSIGPETQLTLSRYIYEPSQSRFGFIARILRGTAAYISGSIGKLAPESVAIETPTATIGIRGTRFCTRVVGPPPPGKKVS